MVGGRGVYGRWATSLVEAAGMHGRCRFGIVHLLGEEAARDGEVGNRVDIEEPPDGRGFSRSPEPIRHLLKIAKNRVHCLCKDLVFKK